MHKNEVGYIVTTGSRLLTLVTQGFLIKRPRVIYLSRGAVSLKCTSSLCFRLDLIVYDNMIINLIFMHISHPLIYFVMFVACNFQMICSDYR